MTRCDSDLQDQDTRWLDLIEALLTRLRGRMSIIQPAAERYQLAASALQNLYEQPPSGRFPEFTSDEARQDFLQHFLSYGLIEEFLSDPSIEDIMINATGPIFVHRTGQGLVKTDARFTTTRELELFVMKLLVFAGHTELDPLNDVELADVRGRVNIAQSPFGHQITITRGKPQPLTILQLIESGMLTFTLAAQLWLYVEGLRIRPANLLISGGPGAGKSTLLNALLSFIPWEDRTVIIEDTLELNTVFLENCSRLESCRRAKTPDLVKNSLRMRPERILVGEVRGVEARDMMTAMSLGKYCMSTIHASSAREIILRLQNEPMNVPPVLVNLVDVFIILKKLNTEGRVQRVVSELVESGGMERQVVLLATVWSYDQAQHQVIEALPSSNYRDHLSKESGWPAPRIIEEAQRRAAILERMQATEQFTDIAAVTRFCQRYSTQPEATLRDLEAMPIAHPLQPEGRRRHR